MPKIDESIRKHKVHVHLNDDDRELLDLILQARMEPRDGGWEWKTGWNASRVAREEGGNFTKNNVNNYRIKHYSPPAPRPQLPDLFVTPPSAVAVRDVDMAVQMDYLRKLSSDMNKLHDHITAETSKVGEMVDNRLKELERRLFGNPAPKADNPFEAVHGPYANNRLP